MLEVVKYLMERLKDKRESHVMVHGQPFALDSQGTIRGPIEKHPRPVADPVACSTLEGIVALYQGKMDGMAQGGVAFSIDAYDAVSLIGMQQDEFGRRRVYAEAKHLHETPFEFDKYMTPENFRIRFQASFYLNDDAMKVLRLISQLGVKGEELNLSDDGISQTVELKSGTVTRGKVELPSDGIPLIPWRTFREVAPVQSKFLLRIKNEGVQVGVALFEVDAKWRLDTIASVRSWLKSKAPTAIVVG
jgi:hypothetical protein